MDFGTKKTHPVDIRLLPFDIFSAHKDFAFHIEKRTGCCCGNAMLAGAGFGNDFGFAHAFGKKCLTQNIVDLVRASMVQLITF